ncbi:MAG: hypothetical protein AB1424_11675 [Thermodesulfobacteriota bacterium]
MRGFALPLILGFLLAGVSAPAWGFDHPESLNRFQEDVKRTRLGSVLKVDQGKVDQLLHIDQKYKPLKEQARRDAVAAFKQLQQVMRNPSPSEGQVQGILSTMMRKKQESLDLQQRQLEEEMAILTPVQQARYLMFLMGLRREMVKEARSLGPPRNGGVGTKPVGSAGTWQSGPRPGAPAETMRPPTQTFAPNR